MLGLTSVNPGPVAQALEKAPINTRATICKYLFMVAPSYDYSMGGFIFSDRGVNIFSTGK
jgi:hypothetical protein